MTMMRCPRVFALVLACVLALPMAASAGEDNWELTLSPSMCAVSMKGDIDAGFRDIVDASDSIFASNTEIGLVTHRRSNAGSQK